MQSSGATKANQCEITRIVTPFNGDETYCLLHIVIHDIDNALRKGVDRGPPSSPRHAADAWGEAVHSERHGPTQKKTFWKTSKNHVRVRHCETFASLSIADGA